MNFLGVPSPLEPRHPVRGARPQPAAPAAANPLAYAHSGPSGPRPHPHPRPLPGLSALLHRPPPAASANPRKRARSPGASPRRRAPHVVSPPAERRAPLASSPRSVYLGLLAPRGAVPPRSGPSPADAAAAGDALAVTPRDEAFAPRPLGAAPLRRSGSLSASGSTSGSSSEAASEAGAPSERAEPPASAPALAAKPSRYLREMDRRAILARISRGEKQSALAKEFRVSRAAICNLYKHRDEVLSRKDGNPLAKHPKKPRPKPSRSAGGAAAASAACPALGPGPASLVSRDRDRDAARDRDQDRDRDRDADDDAASRVLELRSRSSALLLTALRARQTPADALRRCAARLARLVLEEALALVPLRAVAVELPNGGAAHGVAPERPPCALALADGALADGRNAVLDAFRALEPERPVGRFRFRAAAGALEADALPPALEAHDVFLLESVAASPTRALAAVRAALARGAQEERVALVALVVARDVADALRAAFPAVRVVAAQLEAAPADDADAATARAAADALRRRLAD